TRGGLRSRRRRSQSASEAAAGVRRVLRDGPSRPWPDRRTACRSHPRLLRGASGGMTMEFCKIWVEQCDAARMIEDQFGTDKALDYLIREKFLTFLEAAETDAEFRSEIPAFVAEIRTIFERWQLAEELDRARQTEPFDPDLYDEDDDPEDIEMYRQEDIRRSAIDLLLVEQA